MTQKGYRQRRACALAGIDLHVYRRASTKPKDADLRMRLTDLRISPITIIDGKAM